MKARIRPTAIITARAGSKRLPGKNSMHLCGKPLIAWTVEAAVKSRRLGRVLVSTDDKKLARICQKYGAETPFLRPAALAKDHSTHVSVIRHALGWLRRHGGRPGYFMILQPTSPLRTTADIDAAIRLAEKKRAPAVISVRRLGSSELCVPNGAIYLNRTRDFLREGDFFPKKTLPYLMPNERSVDIDTREDFTRAKRLLKARQK